MSEWVRSVFPEVAAGGFSRLDGTVQFYGRVGALVRPDMTVLDYGAGRGAVFVDKRDDYRTALQALRGRVRKVVGVDVDPVIATNPNLDEWHLLGPDGRIPLPDESVDLIVSDYTFEHVENPERCASELLRVLKPGGWLCARTPNKWGLVAIVARLVPNRLHRAVLAYAQPDRKHQDIFPTVYRMNDLRTIRRLFDPERCLHASFAYNAEPLYLPRRRIVWHAAMLLDRLLPDFFAANLFLFIRKQPDGTRAGRGGPVETPMIVAREKAA